MSCGAGTCRGSAVARTGNSRTVDAERTAHRADSVRAVSGMPTANFQAMAGRKMCQDTVVRGASSATTAARKDGVIVDAPFELNQRAPRPATQPVTSKPGIQQEHELELLKDSCSHQQRVALLPDDGKQSDANTNTAPRILSA